MVSINLLASALAAFASLATASPTLELKERNSSPVSVQVFPDGACAQSSVFNQDVTPGQCTTFGRSGNFGARVSTPDEHCVVKFWEGLGCTGKATTWYAPPDSGLLNHKTNCIPIANNGGVFKLGSGVASVLLNCAEDQIP